IRPAVPHGRHRAGARVGARAGALPAGGRPRVLAGRRARAGQPVRPRRQGPRDGRGAGAAICCGERAVSLPLLQRALARERRHVSPFLMLGDPTPELSLALAQTAVAAGASLLELGLPFSDPCADGPAIAAACDRARQAGVSTATALALLER